MSVYGSIYDDKRWSKIVRWQSINGASYTNPISVFQSSDKEPYGIGPATVFKCGAQWAIYYLIRGPKEPGNKVGLALSSDGVQFKREKIVFEADEKIAPGGLSVSYSCYDGDVVYLLLHAYSKDLNSASSLIVKIKNGSLVRSKIVLKPDSKKFMLSGKKGDIFVQSHHIPEIGQPIVVMDNGRPYPYVVKGVGSSVLYLDRPLAEDLNDTVASSIICSKVDLRFMYKTEKAWVGGVTGYGQEPGWFSEWTAYVQSASPFDDWTFNGDGYVLIPYFSAATNSCENPCPIRSDSSCHDPFKIKRKIGILEKYIKKY